MENTDEKLIGLDVGCEKLIGLDIGGTKCAVILGETAGQDSPRILERISFPTEAGKGFPYTFGKICLAIEKLTNKQPAERVGISCGGPLDSERGVTLSPPNLVGWDNIPIVDMLEERFRIPAKLQNDADACALAEWRFGAARGLSHVIFLTFGTGMGAGLILNGKLYSGASGMAGEVGHVRMERFGPAGYGKAGSFEGFCSGGGIAQLAQTIALEKLQSGGTTAYCGSPRDLDKITAKAVADAAEAGDETARAVCDVCGRYLGMGLSVLIDILNPEMIVIGGIFARSAGLLRASMAEAVLREALPRSRSACQIVPAALGERIGDYAALAVGLGE